MPPKAATTPIAMSISEQIGGVSTLTAAMAIAGGIARLGGLAAAFAALGIGLNGLLTALVVPGLAEFWQG
jgi:putative effector of murein hydrolase